MQCPFCASADTQVLETREAAEALRRRRSCAGCGQRFTTYERVESLTLAVRKRDGRREAFDRDKLMRGLVRAAAKRPLSVEDLEEVVERVAAAVREGGGELEAGNIGEQVLRELRGRDQVTYVRFASVYRKFEDVSEFAAELARLDPGSVRSGADDAQLPPNTRRTAAKRTKIAVAGEE